MAFSWISVTTGAKITSAQWNEVKTNTDTVISNLGIAAYSWSEMPVTQNISKPDVSDTQELRSALDYAHNNNTCSVENSSYESIDNAVDDTVVDGGENASFDSGDNVSIDAVDDHNADATADYGYDNNLHGTYNGTKQSTYRSSVFWVYT